jgi:hypothetical protein
MNPTVNWLYIHYIQLRYIALRNRYDNMAITLRYANKEHTPKERQWHVTMGRLDPGGWATQTRARQYLARMSWFAIACVCLCEVDRRIMDEWTEEETDAFLHWWHEYHKRFILPHIPRNRQQHEY